MAQDEWGSREKKSHRGGDTRREERRKVSVGYMSDLFKRNVMDFLVYKMS